MFGHVVRRLISIVFVLWLVTAFLFIAMRQEEAVLLLAAAG